MGSVRRTRRAPWTNTTVVSVDMFASEAKVDLTSFTPAGNPHRWQAQDEHYRARRLAGIVGYTLHDHRHTAAVYLARAGMPLPQLAQQLGHATIAMTMRYARFHADYADVRRYFDRVAQALGREGASARVQSGRADDTSGTRRPATRGGTTDWTTGPAGIEPATPGFGDRCSTN